jgi:glycine betaine/proline transport system substrate-binding protein
MRTVESPFNARNKYGMLLTAVLTRLRFAIVLVLALVGVAVARPSLAEEPAACRVVRLSDIGWTDVTATTALTGAILEDLGYQPKVTVLSVPVTYAAMKNRDIDVFMGNWMPSMTHDQAPFVRDGSVEVVRRNLDGAKYTLAVPAYTYAAGLHDFADIKRFAGPLNNAIYGLEPGNDGNHQVLELIRTNAFGLGGFKLIESSEQGMLAEVERAVRNKQPLVFLAWEPHPMNQRFDLRYLTGGDSSFGPNYGGAKVYTNARAGYVAQCPNVGRLLHNLEFTLAQEDSLMGAILDQHQSPRAAAEAWLKANPAALAKWLQGVSTFDGRPGLIAVRARTAPLGGGLDAWVTGHKVPIGDVMAALVEAVKAHGMPVFDLISAVVHGAALDPAVDLRRPGAASDHEPGLLGRDAGDPVAGGLFRSDLHGDRRAAGGGCGPQALAVPGHAPRARPDADSADLRLSDPDAGPVWPRRRAGPDLHHHLRPAGAGAPDPSWRFVGP